ncbi:MAG TPA: hypothetical protein VE504_00770 [Nitrososphaeraceae archaeon]|nr:hypothetical protein [Nitrososphaeraceae archaeon]
MVNEQERELKQSETYTEEEEAEAGIFDVTAGFNSQHTKSAYWHSITFLKLQ